MTNVWLAIIHYISEHRRFLFEGIRQMLFQMVYPLCFVEYNCTTFQGEYLCNE